jgi:hypothetical protein
MQNTPFAASLQARTRVGYSKQGISNKREMSKYSSIYLTAWRLCGISLWIVGGCGVVDVLVDICGA